MTRQEDQRSTLNRCPRFGNLPCPPSAIIQIPTMYIQAACNVQVSIHPPPGTSLAPAGNSTIEGNISTVTYPCQTLQPPLAETLSLNCACCSRTVMQQCGEQLRSCSYVYSFSLSFTTKKNSKQSPQ